MADRTVKVTLRLLASDYLTGMSKVQKATENSTRSATEKLAAQRQAMEDLGRTSLTLGTVISAGLAVAVGKFAEFDAAMSSVQAATHETASNMGLLRQAALDAGASTVFSATEAAKAIEELSKAGVSTRDILGGGLAGALDLASAGELKVADAAQIAATAMTQFNLKGSDVPKVADLLAAGAGKAQGSVEDLSAALNQGGLVASQAGFGIEETTGALAAFASAGLLGSDAGTSLKTAIIALQKPSTAAAETMKQYAIEVYNSDGTMKSFSEIAGVLQNQLGTLTDEQRNSALATIFGTDAVRSANVLYAQGAEGITSWTQKVDDSGYAAETARLKLDNLKGDVEALGGAVDTALIQSGSGANDTLRLLTQSATTLVTSIGAMPAPVLAVGVGFTALVAVTALVGGGFLALVPRIAATRVAMSELNITAGTLGKGLGKGVGIAALFTAAAGAATSYGSSTSLAADESARLNAIITEGKISGLGAEFGTAQGGATDFGKALNTLYTGNFWTSYAGGPQQLNGAIKALSFGMIDLGAFADTNKAKFTEMGTALARVAETDPSKAAAKFTELVELSMKSGRSQKDAIEQVSNAMPQYEAALIALSGAQGANLSDQERYNLLLGKGDLAAQLARDSTARQAEGLAALSGVAQDAETDIEALSSTILNFGKVNFDTAAAQRDFEAAIDDATAALEKNGATLDVTSEAGRANAAAVDATAQSALAHASALVQQENGQELATAAIQRGRDEVIAQRLAFGDTQAGAEAYADSLGLIPDNVATAASFNANKGAVDAYAASIRAVPSQKITDFIARYSQQGAVPSTGTYGNGLGVLKPPGRAVGGAIYGPGSGTSDTAGLYRLSNGEHVLTAAEVIRLGGQAGVYAFRRQVMSGKGLSGYAAGGAIASARDTLRYMPTMPRSAGQASQQPSSSSLTQNIYATEGMSAAEVARLSANERNWELKGA